MRIFFKPETDLKLYVRTNFFRQSYRTLNKNRATRPWCTTGDANRFCVHFVNSAKLIVRAIIVRVE